MSDNPEHEDHDPASTDTEESLEHEIRKSFLPYPIFRIYRLQIGKYTVPPLMVVIGVPLIVLVVGLIAALVNDAADVFIASPLAYLGPFWIFMALLAYYWFTLRFPQVLTHVSKALADKREFKACVAKWNGWTDDWRIILPFMASFALMILLSNRDLHALWRGTTPESSWESWYFHEDAGFLFNYLRINHVIILPILLSVGLVTLFSSIFMIADLFKGNSVILTQYRRLRAINGLSIGISLWTFFAVVNILMGSLQITSESDLPASTLIYASIGSLALFSILIAPVLLTRAAIINAKDSELEIWEARRFALSQRMYYLVNDHIPDAPNDLDTLVKSRDQIQSHIQEIEAIPALPISYLGILQIVLTSLTPTAGIVADALISRVM